MNVTKNGICVLCVLFLRTTPAHIDTHTYIYIFKCIHTTTGCNMLATICTTSYFCRVWTLSYRMVSVIACMPCWLLTHDIWVPSFKIIKMTLRPIKVQTKSQFKLYRNIWHSEYRKDQNVCDTHTNTYTCTYNPVRQFGCRCALASIWSFSKWPFSQISSVTVCYEGNER